MITRGSRFVWLEADARTCLRHIPISPHRSRVTRHLPADNGWILLSDSTNQRRAMAGYCYQILTNQSVPPMRGTDGHRTFISPHFLLWHVPDTTSIWEGVLRRETKTRLSPVVVRSQVTILHIVVEGYSTVAPPSGKIQPIGAVLPAFNARS